MLTTIALIRHGKSIPLMRLSTCISCDLIAMFIIVMAFAARMLF